MNANANNNKNSAEYERQQEQELIDMRLESSMGTQTEALKKPTYKELEKQQFIAIITAQLEMNDHDGYCSSDECKYTRKIVKAIIVVPVQVGTKVHPGNNVAMGRDFTLYATVKGVVKFEHKLLK